MTRIKMRMATTHVDRHGERMTLGALESMVQLTNQGIIPLGIEHDPRIPPQGRVISAEIVELDDGEYAVEGTAELFDGNLEELENIQDRVIPVRNYKPDEFRIIFDRNFKNDEDQQLINETATLLNNAKIEEEIKKALDPLSVLIVGGSFVLGAIATGFFKKLGEDGYEALKQKITKLSKRKEGEEEKIFKFDSTLSFEEGTINIEVLITNPSVDDIQHFFDNGLKELDEIAPRHVAGNQGLKKVVFEYRNEQLNLLFGVRQDGLPLYP